MSDSAYGVRDFQRRVRRDTAKALNAKVTGLSSPSYVLADIYATGDTSVSGVVLGNFIVRDNEAPSRKVGDVLQVFEDPAGEWFVKPEAGAGVTAGRVFSKLTAAEETAEAFIGDDIGRMYKVDLFKDGPNAMGQFLPASASSRVSVRQMQIFIDSTLDPHHADQEEIPPGTMVVVFKVGGRYLMQAPVFLG